MSLQRHDVQSQGFRQHLLSITQPPLLFQSQPCLVLKLFVWQRGFNSLSCSDADTDDRYSLAMLTRDTPQPTLQHQPTRHRGTVTIMARQITRFTRRQQTLKWSRVRIFILFLFWEQDMAAWTCQMSLIARAIEDSRLWLERNTGTMSAPAAQTPGFLDNAHFIRFWIVTGINLIPATCSLEPDTMLQICGSGSE